MEVSYTTTLDDYVAFSIHLLKRSPSTVRRFGISWALPTVGFLIWAALLATPYPVGAVVLAVVGVLYGVAYPFFYRFSVARGIRALAEDFGARGVIGRITLVLTDETLTERTESVQSVARWRDMKGVEVVGDCTYIYVTGMLAAIVPRRGFERADDYEVVRDFALAKLDGQAELGKPTQFP